jgi:AcrR family transcriptional regulator
MIDVQPAFRLADELQQQSASANLKKSVRTRLRIMAAAAALLDTIPYPQLRGIDVTSRAELSQGSMYRYFRDIPDLVTQLIELHEKAICREFPSPPQIKAVYDYPRIVKVLSWHQSCYLRNRGLFRVMHTQADQLPGVNAAVDRLTLTLHEQLGEFIDAPPVLPFGKGARLLAGQLVGGAMDELIRQLFQNENSNLPIPRTPDALFDLVQLCAILRHRLLHGSDPHPKVIRAVAREFDLSFFDGCFPSEKPKRSSAVAKAGASARKPAASKSA